MRIYGGLISPYVRKACLIAAEKGLPFELVLTAPLSDDADFRSASPFGKIPALRDGDYALADSSAIVAYLDAAHPFPAMIPTDPRLRGKAIWFDEFADTILGGAGLKILFNRFVGLKLLKVPVDDAVAVQGEAELVPMLDWLETAVPDTGWLVGDSVSLADHAVASMLRSLRYVASEPTAQSHPRIAAWYARVQDRPAWQQIAAIEDAPRKRDH